MRGERLDAKLKMKKVNITMIEPRSGFLNIIGIPRAILDPKFAADQYIPFHKLNNIQFNNIISKNESILKEFKELNTISCRNNSNLELNYVHGRVIRLDNQKAIYELEDNAKTGQIDFDYVVLATGRDRNRPVTPRANTLQEFIREMEDFKKKVEANDIISIIGAGAVGLEIAGDVKSHFPEKIINLIHSHSEFPPESLSLEFKKAVQKSLYDSGVKIYLNRRVSRVLQNGNLETLEGEIIESQFNYWSNSSKNNTCFLSNDIKSEFLTSKNNLLVNDHLQLANDTTSINNFFCLGDLVELPIIKNAGWALYMGRQTAKNLINLIMGERVSQTIPELKTFPKGMVLVCGNGDIVSELNNQVELNNETFVTEYQDYCFKKVRNTLDI